MKTKETLIRELKKLLIKIPAGRISTYKIVGQKLGIHPRYVGRLLHANDDPDLFPCYKIVMSDGRIGGYGLGVKKKIARFKKDGISVKKGKIVDFATHLYDFSK